MAPSMFATAAVSKQPRRPPGHATSESRPGGGVSIDPRRGDVYLEMNATPWALGIGGFRLTSGVRWGRRRERAGGRRIELQRKLGVELRGRVGLRRRVGRRVGIGIGVQLRI